MVMTPPKKLLIKPVGKPVTVASVAPMVLYVISVMAVPTQTICSSVPDAEVRVMAVLGRTVMVPVTVVTPAQPPVKVTV
jgi:hypothetical protein